MCFQQGDCHKLIYKKKNLTILNLDCCVCVCLFVCPDPDSNSITMKAV